MSSSTPGISLSTIDSRISVRTTHRGKPTDRLRSSPRETRVMIGPVLNGITLAIVEISRRLRLRPRRGLGLGRLVSDRFEARLLSRAGIDPAWIASLATLAIESAPDSAAAGCEGCRARDRASTCERAAGLERGPATSKLPLVHGIHREILAPAAVREGPQGRPEVMLGTVGRYWRAMCALSSASGS